MDGAFQPSSAVVHGRFNQDEKPGYGYQLKKGATTLTETWDASLGASHNHIILGQAIEWFYQGLAGITPDASGPGFKAIVIRPQPVAGLAWADATCVSIRGPISSRWERQGDRCVLKVAIPANTSATVWVPSRGGRMNSPRFTVTLTPANTGPRSRRMRGSHAFSCASV